jgi:hypothetical protein
MRKFNWCELGGGGKRVELLVTIILGLKLPTCDKYAHKSL